MRLHREVRAAGYAGGYDQVKRYVREVRPREPEEPVRRFERTIRNKPGTSDSAGVAYLVTTLHPAFPDLWEIRSSL